MNNIALFVLFSFLLNAFVSCDNDRSVAKKAKGNVTVKAKKPDKPSLKSEKEEENPEENLQEKSPMEKSFMWKDIQVEPLKNLEGGHYVFTAFEVVDGELLIAGNYNHKNIIRFIKESGNVEVELTDVPLDLLYYDSRLYVLCMKSLFVIENQKIVKQIKHKIRTITQYDKLMFFDEKLSILMANGSSYQLNNERFKKKTALITKDEIGMWIKKTNSNSFEILTKPNTPQLNRKKSYPKNIGSISFLGNSSSDYYCVVEMIENTNPMKIDRIISSSKDNFEKTLFNLPTNTYSYVKNDVKIHNNILYTVFVNEQGITLKSVGL